jgi:Phage integrase, N-terminal SAM-like domain
MREPDPPGYRPPRLLDRVREAIRARHYSHRTQKAYVAGIRRFILFHGKRHPIEMGAAEVTRFLSALAVDSNVTASTQNQALSAILFLYRVILGQDLPWLDDVVRAKRPARLEPLAKHIQAVKLQHEVDLRRGAGWVELPWALARKDPKRRTRMALAVAVPRDEVLRGPGHRPTSPPSPS